MISVAVCDDEAVFLDIVAEETDRIMKNLKKEYTFKQYQSSELFVKDLKERNISPDIVLLDIDMPVITGKDASVILKELYPDCQLIFFTSHEDEIFNAFDYNANGFISKYKLTQRLESNLIRVMKNLEASEPVSMTLNVFGSEGGHERISLGCSDIVYLECIMKKAYITTADGRCMRVKCGLWREMIQKFDKYPFAVPHQNYIINMDHITRITGEELYIGKINKQISISKHRRKDFIKRYTDYSMSKERNG